MRNWQKRRLEFHSGLLKVVVLVIAALLSGTVRAAAFRSVKEGSPAPEVALKSTKGEDVSLSALKGKAVVLAFVTEGQEKSEKALQTLGELDSTHAGKATVLAVVGNAEQGDAASWGSKIGVGFPLLLDTGRTAFGQYGVFVTPATGVVRPDGVFQGEVSGFSASFKGEVEGLLKVALGEASADQVKGDIDRARPADETAQRQTARKEMESARASAARRKTGEAVDAARRAVAADASYGPAYSLLGNLLLDVADSNADEASGLFQKALELSPKDVDAKVGNARMKALKGDTEGAVAVLEDAAKLNPRPQRVYYRLGLVYEKAGKYELAVDAYRRALAKLFAE